MPARLVLVHSPLVGPATWGRVAPILAGRGRQVLVPDLTGTLTAGPPYCARQAEVIARAAAGPPAVLIGHSGAGPLLAQAAGLLGGAQGCIYVDAGLPIPGRTWLETIPPELAVQVRDMADPEGWLPPWPQWWGEDTLAALIPDAGARRRFAADCPRLPLGLFGERHPQLPGWEQTPAAYLRLSEAYDGPAAEARARGWPVTELASHHLGPVTDPGVVADSLRYLLAELAVS